MTKYWNLLRKTEISGPLFVLLTAVLAVVVVRDTGGTKSDLLPIIYLPIILAVVRCGFEVVVGIGLIVTCFYLFLLHPESGVMSFTPQDVVRALVLNTMTLIGAFYARRVQHERERLRHTVEEQELLLNVSQIINSADQQESALDAALLLLRTVIPHLRRAAIFLVEDDQKSMRLAAVIGPAPDELRCERIGLNGKRLGWRPNDLKPLYLADLQKHRETQIASLDPDAGSVVCVGLRCLNVPIGMLYISADRPNAFNESQIKLLQIFADRIGFPLQKLRVQEGLKNLAYTDGMTGLYNFRYFHTRLEDELRRAVRYKRALSLIILDIDGFKGINDRYGHPAGDKVLKEVATILRTSVRETDLAARYGGEEFIILCPETLSGEAAVVGERIRASVEGARFQVVPNETCAVTVSAGVATYPLDAHDGAMLLRAADGALYQAKRTGKNRVVTADAVLPIATDAA